MAGGTTARGFISLLDEPTDDLRLFSLKGLDSVVHSYWAEIAESLPKIVELCEDQSFQHREEAFLLASKVYYYLNDMDKSLECALGSGKLFNITVNSDFTQTLIKQSIDAYIEACKKEAEGSTVDPRLEAIVLAMFDKCFRDGEYKQALGIALETRKMDKVRETIVESKAVSEMLKYCFGVSLRVVKNLDFRRMVLRELVSLHRGQEEKDYFQMTEILILLNDSDAISELLVEALASGEGLLAYQLGFDLCDSSTQDFRARIRQKLSSQPGGEKMDKLRQILDGKTTVELHLSFLCRNNKTDLAFLKNIRDSVEPRNLVCHNATVFANALMHSGTTKDSFLRSNLEWLQKATHWARFSATAGIGVIHKGHLKAGMNLLRPYLPTSPPTSPYSEGGSLYALGIIHANHGQEVTDFLLAELEKAKQNAHTFQQASEVIQHGACLGLGLAAIATGNRDIYQQLLDVVMLENAVAGEAAGLAMGLIMLGSSNEEVIMSMLARAQVAQHEKIIRGLAMGMALVMYGCEEQADGLIEQLSRDKDSILRYGAMFTIGLAYCGTANNSAISRLLHIAVSDVSDDVRRAAVVNIGFLLCGVPEQCPKIVSLLAESYNPHVRYGATLAVGISCAGTGSKEAIALLEPMTKDPVDFVRQGAMIALAMVIIQVSQGENSKVEKVRKLFEDCVADKHEDVMAKFGAILAVSIVNAGGRNVTISPFTSSGHHKNMLAIVGLAVFCQYWYWYPLMHFVSLAFTPVACIGLNNDLKMPVWSVRSNAPPSRFAYPPEFKPPTKEAPKKVTTAVLSTAKKAKARADKKAAEKGEITETPSRDDDKMNVDEEGEKGKEKEKEEEEKKKEEKEKKEESFEIKQNPARVTVSQRAFISKEDGRWQPLKKDMFGILLLKDTQPDQPVALVTDDDEKKDEKKEEKKDEEKKVEDEKVAKIEDVEEDEAPPPEEFEFE